MNQPENKVVNPFFAFNFLVEFFEAGLPDGKAPATGGSSIAIAAGAFSEITGLEATMEPKTIKEGGRNYGEVQRPGPVSFGPVVFKRGITKSQDLWKWFDLVAAGKYAKRLGVRITMNDPSHKALHVILLHRALPIKFKAADFNAQANAVAIEELHLAHEGLELAAPKPAEASR